MKADRTMNFAVAPLVLALAEVGLAVMPTAGHAGIRVTDSGGIVPERVISKGVYVAQTYPPGYGPKLESSAPSSDTSGKDAAPPTKSGAGSTDASGRRRSTSSGSSGTGGR